MNDETFNKHLVNGGVQDTLFASFDIEISKELPEDFSGDIDIYRPLGISCGAIRFSDKEKTRFFYHRDSEGNPQPGKMTPVEVDQMTIALSQARAWGYKIVGWNSLKFDFYSLAEEGTLQRLCEELALSHYDPMYQFFCNTGYFKALDDVSKAMGLEGKVKEVTLNNGETLTDMSGAMAPRMWALGEFDAVLTYLDGDVLQTLQSAQLIAAFKEIQYYTKAGKPRLISIPDLLTVKECTSSKIPDNSWMDNPPKRKDFFSWFKESSWVNVA
jgi:hypothetical protein